MKNVGICLHIDKLKYCTHVHRPNSKGKVYISTTIDLIITYLGFVHLILFQFIIIRNSPWTISNIQYLMIFYSKQFREIILNFCSCDVARTNLLYIYWQFAKTRCTIVFNFFKLPLTLFWVEDDNSVRLSCYVFRRAWINLFVIFFDGLPIQNDTIKITHRNTYRAITYLIYIFQPIVRKFQNPWM